MPTYLVETFVDGQPTFIVPLDTILGELQIGGALKTLTPLEYHTDRQRAWYRGVCLKALTEANIGYTETEWDLMLKANCGGNELLTHQEILLGHTPKGAPIACERLSIVGVGKKNMTQFIENILQWAVDTGHADVVPPPDPELRR